MKDIIFLWEDMGFTVHTHTLVLQMCLFLEKGLDEHEEYCEDYLFIDQYIGFGNDHYIIRTYENESRNLGVIADPNLKDDLGMYVENSEVIL